MDEMPASESEWKKRLTPEQYAILREKGTEAPFTGALLHEKRDGRYRCAACGNALFASDTKFDSGTGWPSFDTALPGAVRLVPDDAHGMRRTEVLCARCGSHLGHLFDDGPTPTGQRYCTNSVCLAFDESTPAQTVPTVSIIIPAFNEEKNMEHTLRAALGARKDWVAEIIVVDDGSRDRTKEIVRAFPGVRLIEHETNKGKSAAVATGVRAAKAECVLFLDADLLGIESAAIEALFAPVRDGVADVAITIRENTPWFMKRLGIDFMSGERAMRKELVLAELDELGGLKGYGIEVFLNRMYIRKKSRIRSVYWKGIHNDLKFSKRGLLRGLWLEMLMWRDVLRVVSPWEAIRQNQILVTQLV